MFKLHAIKHFKEDLKIVKIQRVSPKVRVNVHRRNKSKDIRVDIVDSQWPL